jgi:hypothetical protein
MSVLQLTGTEIVCGGYSELPGSLFVSDESDGLRNFLEHLTL